MVINEVLANSQSPRIDPIELLNTSRVPANISGWYLTDDRHQPVKYRIPDDTFLSPGGFWTTTEKAFAATAQETNAFHLSRHGDEISFFAADLSGAWLGYCHGFKFGASETNTSGADM
ncbi:MAG: lamin tail domain-containing protein [Pedosphaera sp.]|nr:lamin tail domain-containing protein [Pedosphaera sp.]